MRGDTIVPQLSSPLQKLLDKPSFTSTSRQLRGNFALETRMWQRLDNAKSQNDNPDIVDFMGHGDLRMTYNTDGQEFSALVRRNFSTQKGALELGWTFPLATNLKGYVHAFGGYGQSLIDYNYSQKSIGGGFMVDF